MRGFIITLILFLLLTVGIIANHYHIKNVYNEMQTLVSDLSLAPSINNDKKIKAIRKYWENTVPSLHISVAANKIDDVTKYIDAVYASNASNDAALLKINIELLKNALESLIQLEQISIQNILKKQLAHASYFLLSFALLSLDNSSIAIIGSNIIPAIPKSLNPKYKLSKLTRG